VSGNPDRAGRKPPATRRDDVREVMHGVELVDPYRWLEDAKSPETRAWIAAQNDYTSSLLEALPVRDCIRGRLREMVMHDSVGAPILRQGDYFFLKRGAEQDLWSVYRRTGISGQDELLIDPHSMSDDRSVSIGAIAPSQDAGLLAYGIRRGGEDETELRVLDVGKRNDLRDRLPRGLYQSISWKKDGSGFYYSLARRGFGRRIYFHTLGTDAESDPEIFGAGYRPENGIFPEVRRTETTCLRWSGGDGSRSNSTSRTFAKNEVGNFTRWSPASMRSSFRNSPVTT
jgi:prolyl oligopeptidase